MDILTNQSIVTGLYNNLETTIESNKNNVFLINNLEITVTANKTSWATGNLTYTIIINNQSNNIIDNLIVTDILNPDYIFLIVDSVRINSIPAGYGTFTYDSIDGTLNIYVPRIKSNSSTIIEFKVSKKGIEIFKLENIATLSIYLNINNNILKATNINDSIVSNTVIVYGLPSIYKCKEIPNLCD